MAPIEINPEDAKDRWRQVGSIAAYPKTLLSRRWRNV